MFFAQITGLLPDLAYQQIPSVLEIESNIKTILTLIK